MFPVSTTPKEKKNFPDLTVRLVQIDALPRAGGQHSDLFRARWKDDQGGMIAVKVLRAGSGEDPVFFEELQKRLVDFGDVWGQLRHENVARVYGVAYNFSRLPGVVMNHYEETVISYMRTRSIRNDEKLEWIKQIASGLKYLHTRRPPIVHGDLRGANIFVDSTGKCLIADVGMAHLTEMAEFIVMRRATSCRWTAPELMDPSLPPPTTEGPFWTIQTDVFAFAITAMEIFSESLPFKTYQNDSSVLFLIVKGERPEMPQYVQEHKVLSALIPACWEGEPRKRPSMSEVCYRFGLTSYFRYLLGW